MKVIKRNGTSVDFDRNKIEKAIIGAMTDVGKSYINESVAKRIARDLEKEYSEREIRTIMISHKDNLNPLLDAYKIPIQEIEDRVEEKLMASQMKDVARQYIRYRYEQKQKRDKYQEIKRRVNGILKAKNVQNSNANVDEYSFGGKKFESAGVLLKDIALSDFISNEVANAHLENRIYIHDLDSYAIGMHNCSFLDVKHLLSYGFETRNGDVRPPRSISSAMQQVAVLFQCQSQVQFGGVASAHIDFDLAPYVGMSFKKHYMDGLNYVENMSKDYISKINIDSIYLANKTLKEKAYKYALDMTKRECLQAAQGLYHNLNTLESRPGSQVPFTSINFGRDTSLEGRMVTKSLLLASIEGIGKFHRTSIFPISIFQHKKGINANPGDPNYDLKQLAIKSLSKRIYPNFVNCDYSENIEDFNNPDTYNATMGCVDGQEVITYKYKNQIFVESFERVWFKFSHIFEIHTQANGKDKYIDLDNVLIYDTKKGFVNCYRIIRNCSSKWIDINFSQGRRILCTEDHPFETENRGVVLAKGLTFRDDIFTKEGLIQVIVKKTIDREAYSYDVTTESEHFEVSGIYSHNCRTAMSYDRHGFGYSKVGRGNISPVTINLPKIGIKHGICLEERKEADISGFWEELNEILSLTEKALLERYSFICSQNPKSAPFMYKNETMRGFDGESVTSVMKHGSQAVGLIGVAEMCQALFGKNQLDTKTRDFSLSVIEYISDFCKKVSEKNDLNFGVYYTPAEGCCYTICEKLKDEFGELFKITDKDFLTNSIHVPVWEELSVFDKINIEAPFCKYGTSGCITYVEFDSKISQNKEAIETVINYAMNKNIPYFAINFPIDTCLDCGYSDQIESEECPICHSSHIERLARVTGYLTSDISHFNKGKQDEVKRRFKHYK